jgi:hypothetical protein
MRTPLSIRLVACLVLLLTVTSFFSPPAHSKKFPFTNSTVVPGAEGSVNVKKDGNGNYHIDVYIENLPDPSKLTPGRKAYVVWVQTLEKGDKNIGQIKTGSSMFSKTKKASMSTVSIDKPIKVYVTAEDDGSTETPGDVKVLTTEAQ